MGFDHSVTCRERVEIVTLLRPYRQISYPNPGYLLMPVGVPWTRSTSSSCEPRVKNPAPVTFAPGGSRTLRLPVGFDHSVTWRERVEIVTLLRPYRQISYPNPGYLLMPVGVPWTRSTSSSCEPRVKNPAPVTFAPGGSRTLRLPVGFDHSVTWRERVEIVTLLRPYRQISYPNPGYLLMPVGVPWTRSTSSSCEPRVKNPAPVTFAPGGTAEP